MRSRARREGRGGGALEAGVVCVYYPEKKSVDDNRHWTARVEGFTRTGLVKISYQVLEEGGRVRSVRGAVSPKRLAVGQAEIPVVST